MPLSKISQLYRDCKFYLWRKSQCPEKTTDLPQVTDNLFYIILYRVHLAWTGFKLTTFISRKVFSIRPMIQLDNIIFFKNFFFTIVNVYLFFLIFVLTINFYIQLNHNISALKNKYSMLFILSRINILIFFICWNIK